MTTEQRRPRRLRPDFVALEARIALSASPTSIPAGALDPSFGGGRGFVTLPVGVTPDPVNANSALVGAVAVQPDGKVVIAGTVDENSTHSFALQRLNADGTPDASFGSGGLFLFHNSIRGFAHVAAVFVQADGKIIEAGDADVTYGDGTDHYSYLAIRVNRDGTLDATFGGNGVASYPAGVVGMRNGSLQAVNAAAVQPEGKIVLAGSAQDSSITGGGGTDFAAVRLGADGKLDTSFGTAGTATVRVTSLGSAAEGVGIQPDGRIILAGSATYDVLHGPRGLTIYLQEVAVVRLGADGKLDTSFGSAASGGQVINPPAPSPTQGGGQVFFAGLAVQADGKILLGQRRPASSTVTRLNADGTVDVGFGQGSAALPPLASLVAILPLADGKVLLAGSVDRSAVPSQGFLTEFATIRLDADGSPDATYGNTPTPGLAEYPFGAASLKTSATALAVDPRGGGQVVVVGDTSVRSGVGFEGMFAAARILLQPSAGPGVTPTSPPLPASVPPPSFDGTSRTNPAVYLPSIGAFAYRPTVGPDVVVPFGIPGPGQTIPAPADYEGAGTSEIAAYLPALGAFAIRPSAGGPDQLIPFGIAGAGQTIPAPADYEGYGKADVAAYLPALGSFAVRPATGGPDQITQFGIAGAGQSIPVPGDYDGVGKAELAVYLPALGAFAIRPSDGSPDRIVPFGVAGMGRSIPVPGDYDGSGRTELAVYLPALGLFAYRPAGGGPDVITPFGAAGDGSVPVPGDYSGSGHAELAVYDPSYGIFAYRPAGGGADVIEPFGPAGLGQSIPAAGGPAAPASASLAIPIPGPTVMALSVGGAGSDAVPAGPLAMPSARRGAKSLALQARP